MIKLAEKYQGIFEKITGSFEPVTSWRRLKGM
jgi:hypothetical protein